MKEAVIRSQSGCARRRSRSKCKAEIQKGQAKGQRKKFNWLSCIEYAPTYRPSLKEFENPLEFIRRIEPEASKFGICKITVPEEFRSQVDRFPVKLKSFAFTAREQKLKEHVWESFGKTEIIYEHPHKFDLKLFEKEAKKTEDKLLKGSRLMPPSYVESEFWRLRNSSEGSDQYILYGNDVEGSACDRSDPNNIGSTKWNLEDLGKSEWSLLRHAPIDYPGITSPMLYIGSLFSTFFWHVEDHWMHSINFSHYGAIKTWYGVPSSHAEAFEKVVMEKVYRKAMRSKSNQDLDPSQVECLALRQLLAKNTLFLPKLLIEAGVPIYKTDQEPGDFILTFPRGYHSGFSHGFNIGEAVNFALPEWVPIGEASLIRYRHLQMGQIIPHHLLLVKEAAAVFDRLQETKSKPTDVDVQIIRQLCSFADRHAQLRFQVSKQKGLEEVSISDPLRTLICLVCDRHICGAYVVGGKGQPTCMECSLSLPTVSISGWKVVVIKVPDIVRVIHFLEHQFWSHYRVQAKEHPLSWSIPKKARSFGYISTRKRKVRDEERALMEDLSESSHFIHESSLHLGLLDDSMEVVSQSTVDTDCGKFPRTVLCDDHEEYLLAQELLMAVGAPAQRSIDVKRIVSFLVDPSLLDDSQPVNRLVRLEKGSVKCTVLNRQQIESIVSRVEPSVSRWIEQFLDGLW